MTSKTATLSAFQEAIEHNLKGIDHVSPGCAQGCSECPEIEEDEEFCDEGGFSWSSCDSCGSRLGGDRFSAHGIVTEGKRLIHLEICIDCLCFHANGDEPETWEG